MPGAGFYARTVSFKVGYEKSVIKPAQIVEQFDK